MRLRTAVCISLIFIHTVLYLLLMPLSARAASPGVAISEVAITNSASGEFVELYNPSVADIDLTGWKLEYHAASSATTCDAPWTTTKPAVLSGVIQSHGYFLLASKDLAPSDAVLTFNMSVSAATIRLVNAGQTTIDAVAWGKNTPCGIGAPVAKIPPTGQSLERQPAPEAASSDNNTDFVIQSVPTPQASLLGPAPAPSPASPVPAGDGAPAVLELTELLIDPVAPGSDAEDEFVEIHNAGSDAVQMEGYVVKTGSHQHTLPSSLLGPDEYMIITSGESSISLTNSGGVANLLDPTGAVIDTAGAWESAQAGASWALIEDAWRWTLTPTPREANIYTPLPGASAADGSGNYPGVQLTELLPDPASPLTDAADEYIEIYNPTDEEVDLTGYTLKTGHDLGSKYVIKDVTVPADGYVALKSATTKLALANDGSSVALYAPDGTQLGATVTYPKAPAGAAWAHFDNGWGWTSESTPGVSNVLGIVAAAATKTTAKAKAATTKAAKAKASPKPKASPKAKAAKTAKPLVAGSTSAGGHWLLFALAAFTIGYIIYEFRYDIRNYYFKLRGYPVGRPAPVPVTIGRGDDRAGERPGRG